MLVYHNRDSCAMPNDQCRAMLMLLRFAGSVAVRGWLYSQQHPAPRQFQAMRGPQAQLVQKAAAANLAEANAVYCRLAAPRSTPDPADASAGQNSASAASRCAVFLMNKSMTFKIQDGSTISASCRTMLCSPVVLARLCQIHVSQRHPLLSLTPCD